MKSRVWNRVELRELNMLRVAGGDNNPGTMSSVQQRSTIDGADNRSDGRASFCLMKPSQVENIVKSANLTCQQLQTNHLFHPSQPEIKVNDNEIQLVCPIALSKADC